MPDIPATVEAESLAQPTYNAGDAKQVNNARKGAARRERERLDVIQALLQNTPTALWLWDIMESCKVFGNPMVSDDTHATYFNLGEQNIGKRILMDCLNFPELYMKMVSEAKTRK